MISYWFRIFVFENLSLMPGTELWNSVTIAHRRDSISKRQAAALRAVACLIIEADTNFDSPAGIHPLSSHTHTHTYIYIYIYISGFSYIELCRCLRLMIKVQDLLASVVDFGPYVEMIVNRATDIQLSMGMLENVDHSIKQAVNDVSLQFYAAKIVYAANKSDDVTAENMLERLRSFWEDSGTRVKIETLGSILRAAAIFCENGKYKDAIKWANRALKLNQGDPLIEENSLKILLEGGKKVDDMSVKETLQKNVLMRLDFALHKGDEREVKAAMKAAETVENDQIGDLLRLISQKPCDYIPCLLESLLKRDLPIEVYEKVLVYHFLTGSIGNLMKCDRRVSEKAIFACNVLAWRSIEKASNGGEYMLAIKWCRLLRLPVYRREDSVNDARLSRRFAMCLYHMQKFGEAIEVLNQITNSDNSSLTKYLRVKVALQINENLALQYLDDLLGEVVDHSQSELLYATAFEVQAAGYRKAICKVLNHLSEINPNPTVLRCACKLDNSHISEYVDKFINIYPKQGGDKNELKWFYETVFNAAVGKFQKYSGVQATVLFKDCLRVRDLCFNQCFWRVIYYYYLFYNNQGW